MKHGRISEVPLYSLSSVVIQCLIIFLAISMSFITWQAVFKWCTSQKQWIRMQKQKKAWRPSRKKEKLFNQGLLRCKCTFCASCVQTQHLTKLDQCCSLHFLAICLDVLAILVLSIPFLFFSFLFFSVRIRSASSCNTFSHFFHL